MTKTTAYTDDRVRISIRIALFEYLTIFTTTSHGDQTDGEDDEHEDLPELAHSLLTLSLFSSSYTAVLVPERRII